LRKVAATIGSALLIVHATLAVAQSLSPVGRYNMEWAQMDKGLRVDLTSGTRLVEVVGRDVTDPPDTNYKMRDATTLEHLWYLRDLGDSRFEAWTGGFGIGVFVGPVVGQGMQGFYLEAEVGSGHNPGTYVAVGRRVTTTQPPPPPPPPPSGSLAVAVTAPKAGATVRGTVWLTVWVNGSSGGSKTYTLSEGGVQRGTAVTTNSSGPVSLSWPTSVANNGARTLRVTVREGTRTGTGTVGVTVAN
jgi:Bacterial Ig domain